MCDSGDFRRFCPRFVAFESCIGLSSPNSVFDLQVAAL